VLRARPLLESTLNAFGRGTDRIISIRHLDNAGSAQVGDEPGLSYEGTSTEAASAPDRRRADHRFGA
jgi:hypothetical protein